MKGPRFDERDTMFARMARRAGTPPYDDYYARRPELQRTDDRIRGMPGLCQPGGRHYDPEISARAETYFEEIPDLEPEAAAVPPTPMILINSLLVTPLFISCLLMAFPPFKIFDECFHFSFKF